MGSGQPDLLGGSIGLSVFALAAVAFGDMTADRGYAPLDVLTTSYGAVFHTVAIPLVIAAAIAFATIRGQKEDLLPDPG